MSCCALFHVFFVATPAVATHTQIRAEEEVNITLSERTRKNDDGCTPYPKRPRLGGRLGQDKCMSTALIKIRC